MEHLSISDASSKTAEDRPSPSSPEVQQMPLMGGPLAPNADADQPQEYNCKYCAKSFYNKQALRGHQNAHKIKRALEKAAHESWAPGSTELHLGWAAPDPRSVVPQSRGRPQNLDLDLRLSCSRPVYPELSGFAAPRTSPGRYPGEGEDEQHEDDSEIELSLKL